MIGFTDNKADTIKAHITSAITTVTASTWTDFTGFDLIEDETSGGVFVLDADTKTFRCLRSGLYHFGGCIHVQNNTAGSITATILTRLFCNGTTELRCSQRGKVETINKDGEDVLSYNGTVSLNCGDEITLQYFTNNADLDFDSNSNFINQVAATLWLHYMGER